MFASLCLTADGSCNSGHPRSRPVLHRVPVCFPAHGHINLFPESMWRTRESKHPRITWSNKAMKNKSAALSGACLGARTGAWEGGGRPSGWKDDWVRFTQGALCRHLHRENMDTQLARRLAETTTSVFLHVESFNFKLLKLKKVKTFQQRTVRRLFHLSTDENTEGETWLNVIS